jgi:hypothetical protein
VVPSIGFVLSFPLSKNNPRNQTKWARKNLSCGFVDHLTGPTKKVGDPRHILTEEPEWLMKIPDDVRKAVVFLGYKNREGVYQLAGTAFFVTRNLLGLMHGHWDTMLGSDNASAPDRIETHSVNMGIAIVVPAYKILEVIEQPMIRKSEDEKDKQKP